MLTITKYITLANYWDIACDRIFAYYKKRENVRYEYMKMIQCELGSKVLDRITVDELEEWKTKLRKDGISNEQIATAIGVLRKLFHEAKKDRLIDINPMDKFKGYPTVHRPLFQLTDEQERKLIQAAKKKDNPELFLLMISTGIQWQELAAVRRESLLKRIGALELTHKLIREKGLVELPSKSVRMIPLSTESRELFRLALIRQDNKDRQMKKNPQGLVFTSPKNKFLGQCFGKQWREICQETGLYHLKPVDISYSYGIRAIRAGANPKTLMRYQGYLKEDILDRYYSALDGLTEAEKAYGDYYEKIMRDGDEA